MRNPSRRMYTIQRSTSLTDFFKGLVKLLKRSVSFMMNYRIKMILFWKIALVIFGSTVLATCLIRIPGFWSNYVFDMVGPAMGYILLRVQCTSKESTFLSFKFTPESAALIIFGICIVIETSQYFKLYDAHFDPYD